MPRLIADDEGASHFMWNVSLSVGLTPATETGLLLTAYKGGGISP